MQPGPAEKCRPWPKEAIAAVAADLRAMPELQLCLIRERGPDFVQRVLKRDGKIFIRIFPNKPVAKKPLETRMGKGKADVDYWAARVRPGTMLYELAGVSESRAREAFSRVAMKMPVRCRFVGRRVTA